VQIAAGSSIYLSQTHAARLTWTAWLAAYLLASSAARRDDRSRPWMLAAISHFSIALAFVAILQRFTAGGRVFWVFDSGYQTGQMGPWVYDNQYAGFVLLTLPVSLWRAHGWTFAGPALQVASVFVSGSLAGSLLVVIEALAVMALRAARNELPVAITVRRIAAVGVLAGVILAVTGWDSLAAKLEREEPLRVRADLAASTLQMARDRPWLGWGLGTWSTAYPAYARFDDGAFDNQAHNDWVQWLAEGGVVFFLAMLLLAGGAAGAGWRTGWALGLVFVLAHCLIEYHFQERPVFGAVFFAIAGLTRATDNY
jgi:O-antigen ligase